jgi:hypothetical protein
MESSESRRGGATSARSHQLLVVAAEEVGSDDVADAIVDRAGGTAGEVRLLAPAIDQSALEHAMGDVDQANAQARDRAARSAEALRKRGLNVAVGVGDPDLRLAIQDSLQTFDADEIVIVAHRDGGPYLERQGIEEAERDFEPPITELYVDGNGAEPSIAEIEHKPGGQPAADPQEVEPGSRNLPPFSPRDLLGITVAIIGTIILVVLAASGNDNLNSNGGFGTDDGGFTNQSARILIAGLMALINLAHVIGLVLFQAGPYRGFARTFFARASLYGTPLAILACLLLL